MQIYRPHYLTSLSQREVPSEIVVPHAEETTPVEETTADRNLMRVVDAFPRVPSEGIPSMLLAMEAYLSLDRREISRIPPENTGCSKIIGLFIYITISLTFLLFF